MRRHSTRDYKKPKRSGLDLERYREFGAGLGVGLLIALLVYAFMNRAAQTQGEPELKPEPRAAVAAATADAEAGAADEGTKQYDFYEMLPKFEVVVPEKETDVKRDVRAVRIERPGVYVLQAGSYRNLADAERMSSQLNKQGVDSKVQRVAVDSDVWHRVRIGPISELVELNRVRDRLRAADVDALVIRVGD